MWKDRKIKKFKFQELIIMLSKNLVLRKRCYYYGDTKIKTDSKIYLSKTKMELMKKNFLKY